MGEREKGRYGERQRGTDRGKDRGREGWQFGNYRVGYRDDGWEIGEILRWRHGEEVTHYRELKKILF